MNKKIIWVVGGLVVIALAAFLWNAKNKNLQTGMMGWTGGFPAKEMSLKQLLTSSGSQTCTFKDDSAAAKIEGTIYVSSGKMRTDFSSVTEGRTFASHMIVTDNIMHTWVDGMNSGFKAAFGTAQTGGNQSVSGSLDAEKKMNYNCGSWTADQSRFALPSGVTFTDISAMMNSAGANVNAGAGSCSTCDSVPELYKAQCRTSLGCK